MGRRLLALAITAVLFASCTGSIDDTPPSAAATAAEANAPTLEFTDELATTEMLDVRTGEVTALDDIVTRDRAVLLWYWAPD